MGKVNVAGGQVRSLRLLASLILLFILNVLPAAGQSTTPVSSYTYADCRGLDKQQLRDEIERHAKELLDSPQKPIDVDTLVLRKWAELAVDATIDGEIEKAVNQVREDEGYWSRLWSGWSPDKADEFARRIISDTFNSPVFALKLDELSTAIGTDIAREIQSEFARAASASFLCLQAYVGTRYSTTLFSSFEENIRLDTARSELNSTATHIEISPLDVHSKALGGVGLIVVTEIARRVAIKLSEKIAERVAGKIIGRVLGKAGSSLIPVAGWVIGIGLIVWDLWEGGQGALPQIQESLSSEDVKAKIRGEIATSIRDGLPQESALVAVEISTTLIDEWDGFCTKNHDLCLVADENPGMRSLLEYVAVNDLSRLSEFVNLIIASNGRSTLDKAIENGQLEQLLALPVVATTLLSDTHSVADTLAWGNLAGEKLAAVSAYKIHKKRIPADFDAASLALLLEIDEAQAIDKLTTLAVSEMQTLLNLPPESITALARGYSQNDLHNLATVLAQPQITSAAILAAQVIQGETTITQLKTLSDSGQISTAGQITATTLLTTSPTLLSSILQTTASYATSISTSIRTFFASLTLAQGAGLGAVLLGLLAVIAALVMSRRD